MKPLLSRKEIAQMTGLCVKTIKVKERSLGLAAARAMIPGERVFYNAEIAVKSLKARRLLS